MEKEINITEMLKKKGITPTSRYHDYDYLYKSIVEVIKNACDETVQLCADSSYVEVNVEEIIKVKEKIYVGISKK